MLTKTRKNKSYVSVLLNEVTEEAFQEATTVCAAIEGPTVVKPNKEAWAAFVKMHSLTLDKVKAGETYKILGTVFTIVRGLDHSRTGSNEWFPIVRYFDTGKNDYEEYGIIATNNFAVGVHETCFKNKTGMLLYF